MSTEIDPDELTDSYEYIDESEDVKAKLWVGEMMEKRLYVRVRSHEDRRKFDEYYVVLQPSVEDALEQARQ